MGAEPEVKKKGQKLSLCISLRFLNLTRNITLKKQNRLFFDDTFFTPAILSTRAFTINEVKAVIRYLIPKKVLDYDLITD